MALDDRGHVVPSPAEAPRRDALETLSESVNDLVFAANATARATIVSTIAPTATRPLYVHQLDTAELWVHTAAAGSGRPFYPRARYWRTQRTTQSSTIGTTDWVPDLAVINLPADAPAGRYVVRGCLFAYLGGSVTEVSIHRTVYVGATEVDANLRNQPVQGTTSGAAVAAVFEAEFSHLGGATDVELRGMSATAGAFWAARAATYMCVEFLGTA